MIAFEILGIFLLVFAFCWTVHGAIGYARFAWRPRYFRDMWTKFGMRFKGAGLPLWMFGYEVLDSDRYGTVWEMPEGRYARVLTVCQSESRALVRSHQRLLEVIDTTTAHHHLLAVPMIEQTSFAKGAAAWTFSLAANQYNPQVET